MISNWQTRLHDYLVADHGTRIPNFFRKSLYAFLILKIVFLWSVTHDIVSGFRSRGSGVGFLELDIFLVLLLLLLGAALIVRANLFLALAIAGMSVCLSRITGSMVNGSDSVLNIYLMLCAGFSVSPGFVLRRFGLASAMIFNFTWLLCRVQLVLIYAVSGLDKLFSEAWRSGAAIHSINNLEYFWNPALAVSFSQGACLAAAWSIILFEISFAVFIWFRRVRIPLLVAGVVFHLGIIFVLGLPDFGLVMIITYSLFLPPVSRRY